VGIDDGFLKEGMSWKMGTEGRVVKIGKEGKVTSVEMDY